MVSGKFFLMSLGFLVLYTLYVNFGYIKFMDASLYNVYLYDPAGTQKTVSTLVQQVSSKEALDVPTMRFLSYSRQGITAPR